MKLAIQTGSSQLGSNGWMTLSPVSKPIFSAVSISAWEAPPFLHSAMKAAAFGSFAAICSASGWSGAMPTKLAP